MEIEFGVTKLPKYDVPDGYTSWEYLRKLCYEGLEKRYAERADELRERLDYELGTIKNMGYVDYFLIVWDFIKYAKDHGIAVGPGRGLQREVLFPTAWELRRSIRSDISFCSSVF